MPRGKRSRHRIRRVERRRSTHRDNAQKPKYEYRPMGHEEILASREKLNISEPKVRSICSANRCDKSVESTCNYCHKGYCSYHSDPVFPISLTEKTTVTHKSDPVLYEKIQADWNREDGHPCPQYRLLWTRPPNTAIKPNEVSAPTSDSVLYSYPHGSSPRAEYPNKPVKEPIYQSTQSTNRPNPTASVKRPHNISKVLIILILITLVAVAFILTNTHSNSLPKEKPNGIAYNPYNASQGYQGTGYYRVYNGSEVYFNNSSQFNSVVNTTIPTSTSTSTIATTTIDQLSLDSEWASNFFSNVSAERGSQYNYCPSLSQFADIRFNTMASNYGISHYGYDADFQNFSSKNAYAAYGEEVFYPSGYTPSAYLSDIMSSAPLHWQLLSNSTFEYYGYDLQNGPTYEILGPGGGYGQPCSVTEIPGPNINISQYFAQYGCSVVEANDTWFVIEISSFCSGFHNITSTTTVPISQVVATQELSGQQVLSACVANVTSDLSIAQDKLPSGTSITIVNETPFDYELNNVTSIANINRWISFWNSGYTYTEAGVNCNSDPGFYACQDSSSLSSELASTGNLPSGAPIGAGVAVKFDFPPQYQSNGATEVSPILCDPSGAVMSNSNSYLRNKNSYS